VAPDVIVIHGALLAAVHPQPAVVVTFTVTDDPALGGLSPAGEIAYVQAGANAA
jgi:hypothetical protein